MMTFSDIENANLRAFNRFVMAMNINSDKGDEASAAYIGQFVEADRAKMLVVANLVAKIGVEATKNKIMEMVELDNTEEAGVHNPDEGAKDAMDEDTVPYKES